MVCMGKSSWYIEVPLYIYIFSQFASARQQCNASIDLCEIFSDGNARQKIKSREKVSNEHFGNDKRQITVFIYAHERVIFACRVLTSEVLI